MEFRPERLRELRDGNGYSLGVLSRLLKARAGIKLTRSSLSQLENGRVLPRLGTLIGLCGFYGVEVNYFFSSDQTNSLLDNMDGKRRPTKPRAKEGDNARQN
jgi:transcriptional regulator with XRE-family HTH domain